MKTRVNGGWGSRAQIGGLYAALQDLPSQGGNGDGLWFNELRPRHEAGDRFTRNPMLLSLQTSSRLGWSTKDEVEKLAAFAAGAEAKYGQPLLDPEVAGRLQNPALAAVEKAIALERLGRHPKDVTEGFITAAGSVDGHEIATRQLFHQRFRPIGEASGQVILVSPGFQETGRDFQDLIHELCLRGHDVVAMDHQWAGYSEGRPGGMDSGFGVARDVAAMSAFAAKLAHETYGEAGRVTLYGNSMGGGPGVLLASSLNEAGKIELGGEHGPMPRGLPVVVSAPFLGTTPNPVNDTLELAAGLPILNAIQLPSAGIPVLSRDPQARQRGAQSAVLANTKAQLGAFEAPKASIERLFELTALGFGPAGLVEIVHGQGDTLASHDASQRLVAAMGGGARLTTLETKDHVFQGAPALRGHVLAAIDRVTRPPQSLVEPIGLEVPAP